MVTIHPVEVLENKEIPHFASLIRNDIRVCYLGGGKQRGAKRPAAFLLPIPSKTELSFRALPAETAVQAGKRGISY